MTWRLVVAAPTERQLARLPEKAAAAVESLFTVAANPRRVGTPLRFILEGVWVARRGPYRVLYRLDAKTATVLIVAVGHRASIYRHRGPRQQDNSACASVARECRSRGPRLDGCWQLDGLLSSRCRD